MQISLFSPETFEFFARFLLAGFIMLSVRSRFVATQRPKPSEALLDAVVLSLVNQAVFAVLAWGVGLLPEYLTVPVGTMLGPPPVFFFEVLILPACVGVVLARSAGSDFANGFLRKLSMPGTHPVSRAYDHAFQQHRLPGFMILSFRDETVVYGYFGEKSLAATDPERSDIYIERIYTVSDGTWIEAMPRRGALVSLADLRSIEFIESELEDT